MNDNIYEVTFFCEIKYELNGYGYFYVIERFWDLYLSNLLTLQP
jgi:hypothetical protein